MSRKKKYSEPVFVNEVAIFDIAEEGRGVGKADDLVFFVDKAVPGDVADLKLTKKKKNFAEAVIVKLKKQSPYRTEPFCSHFGACGGCKWQHMSYPAQLTFKEKSVRSVLERVGKVDTQSMEPILGSAENRCYRNKLEFTFSNKRWLNEADMALNADTPQMNALGFHLPGRFDKILDIERCFLQAEPSNQLRLRIKAYALENGLSFYDLRKHTGDLRNLIIRTSSNKELMVVVVFAYAKPAQIEGLMEFLKISFPQITSLQYIVNQKKNDAVSDQEIITYQGRDHIFEEMPLGNGLQLKFKISAKSFYQTNSAQAYQLYAIAKEFAGLQSDDLVYDLYTGAGTIANFVAKGVKQVVGIEYVSAAIEDAKFNATLNGISNTAFYAGDIKDILIPAFIAKHGKPNVVITDPPRAGMHPDVVKRLLEMETEKIVYVSCNAATQARDLALLNAKYQTLRIKPVDMFPHTQHVENVALLKLR